MNIRSALTAAVLWLSLCGLVQAAEPYQMDLVVSRDGALIGKSALVAKAGAGHWPTIVMNNPG